MKIVAESAALLTNFEVAGILGRQAKDRLEVESKLPLPGARRSTNTTVTWQAQQEVADQVLAHLAATPCTSQTRESIAAFAKATAKFRLTQAEVIALVNSQPESRVEIHLIVEECEERLSHDEVGELLQLCQTLSPLADDAES